MSNRKISLRIESNGVEIFNADVSEMQFNPGSEGVTLAAQYDPPLSKLEQLEQMAELRAKFGPQVSQNDSVGGRLTAVPSPVEGE